MRIGIAVIPTSAQAARPGTRAIRTRAAGDPVVVAPFKADGDYVAADKR